MSDESWYDRNAEPDSFAIAIYKLGMSQAGAARFLDISPRQVARYIDGTREIPIPTMMLLRLLIEVKRRFPIPPTPTGQRRR
jgi:hypothetical protein